MECCRCGRKPIENNITMFPIDKPGKNRRWSCAECMNKKEKASIPKDVNKLVEIITRDK